MNIHWFGHYVYFTEQDAKIKGNHQVCTGPRTSYSPPSGSCTVVITSFLYFSQGDCLHKINQTYDHDQAGGGWVMLIVSESSVAVGHG